MWNEIAIKMYTLEGAMVRDTKVWRRNWECGSNEYTSKYIILEWQAPAKVRIDSIKVASLWKTLPDDINPAPVSVCYQALVVVPRGVNEGQPGELGAAYGSDKFYLGQQEQIVWFDINIARVDTIRTNLAQRGFHTKEKLNYVLQVNAGDSLWFLADNDSSRSEVTPRWEACVS